MHFLGCLFALILGLLFIGVMFIGSIINAIFSLLGIKKRVTNTHYSHSGNASGYGQRDRDSNEDPSQQQQRSHQGQQTKKIFEKNDSEYVDFEEV